MPSSRRVAWVTGGGRGIGRACALALAGAGHDVALSARSEAELARVAEECAKIGARAVAIVCDLTDAASISRAHEATVAKLGPVDVLVNAAGVAKSAPFHRTDAAFMEMHWRLNVMGVFHASRAVVPAMLERGWGRIVNVASVAGKVGMPYVSAYSTSKHALLGLTRSMAAEYAAKGITVNAVCPGYVDSQMTDESIANMTRVTGMSEADARARLIALNPQKRFLEPEEVASVVAHLASAQARGINGQAITIDGGAIQW